MKTHNSSVIRAARPASPVILVLLAALLLLARPASAQGTFDIHNNLLQPGDDFDLFNAVWVVNNVDDGYQSLAMPFIPGIGSNVIFNAIYVGVEDYRSGQSSPLILSLREDNAGLPGNIIESISGSVSNRALYGFASSLNPVLTGGTQYWIVAAGDTGAYANWYASDNDTVPSKWSGNGTTWNVDVLNYSLKVEGLNPVPEPSVAFLGGLGLLLTLVARRRR